MARHSLAQEIACSCPLNRLQTAFTGIHLSQPFLLELCSFAYINIQQGNIQAYEKGSGTLGWCFPNPGEGHECRATHAMYYFVSCLILWEGVPGNSLLKAKRRLVFLKKPVMFPRTTLMNTYSSKHSNFVTKKNF